MEKIMIDAMGKQCPIPVVMMKKALDEQPQVSCAEILVDNEIAVKNLAKLANSQNCSFQWKKLEEKKYQVVLTRNSQSVEAVDSQGNGNGRSAVTVDSQSSDSQGSQNTAQTANCCLPEDKTVVAISSAAMGNGNDELGHTLMKGFLYALSQLEKLPEKILFYNGGVTWTTEGSDSLEDLKTMEEQGVEILSCGTCLNFYGLTDKLKVGSVTNMYDIVESMAKADKVIHP